MRERGVGGFERITEVSGAFDKRHADPNKNYGVHGMQIRFVLKGPKAAMQFLVYTNIHLDHVAREMWGRRGRFGDDMDYRLSRPNGADIGYHAYVPQYEGQTSMGPCEYLGGAECFYDGTSLGAEEFLPEFIAGGSDAVWAMLEQRYHDRFETPNISPTEGA